MNKHRLLAPVIMLSSGALAAITMFVMGYELRRMLGILLFVLILFYVLGSIFSYILSRFDAQNKMLKANEEDSQGEVIEKESKLNEEGAENEAHYYNNDEYN